MRCRLFCPALLLAAACADPTPDASSHGWVGTTAIVGDTTVVTTERGAVRGALTIDSVEVVFGGAQLINPVMLVALDAATLVVADPQQLQLVHVDGTHLRTFGRGGGGPGEFSTIGAIGGSGDSIVALDRRNQRYTIFRTDGTVLTSGLFPQAGALAILHRGRVALLDGAVVAGWGSRVSFSGEASFGGVVRHLPAEDTARELDRVVGQPYIFNEEALSGARSELYGPIPMTAVAPDGRHALTDGVEYCVTATLSADEGPTRICRVWDRIGVPGSIRNPDYEALAAASGHPIEFFGPFRALLPDIKIGDRRNAIDAIRYDREGRLWVQVVDSLTADVHPLLTPFAGTLGATRVHWDLFGTDGRLEWQLIVPASFTPWDAIGGIVYGLVEQPDGAIAVGRFRLREEWLDQ